MSSTVPTTKPNPAMRAPTAKTHEPDKPPMTPKRVYIIGYNLLSFVLWYAVLFRVAYGFLMLPAITLLDEGVAPLETPTSPSHSDPTLGQAHNQATTLQGVAADIFSSTGTFVSIVQSLAILEVAHAALGVVRAPLITTVLQVASRLVLVWGVVDPFGQHLFVNDTTSLKGTMKSVLGHEDKSWNQWAYVGMLLAWSVTEVVRYGYFTFFIAGAQMPAALRWARYNLFFALYPIGIAGECWLIYNAVPYAAQLDMGYDWFLRFVLAVYVPGSYFLYTHMMSQRRRIAKGKGKAKPHTE